MKSCSQQRPEVHIGGTPQKRCTSSSFNTTKPMTNKAKAKRKKTANMAFTTNVVNPTTSRVSPTTVGNLIFTGVMSSSPLVKYAYQGPTSTQLHKIQARIDAGEDLDVEKELAILEDSNQRSKASEKGFAWGASMTASNHMPILGVDITP